MKYFATTLESSFVIYETDDDITKYRIIDSRTIEEYKKLKPKPKSNPDNINISDSAIYTSFTDIDWIPIKNEEYFRSWKEEISEVDVFAYML